MASDRATSKSKGGERSTASSGDKAAQVTGRKGRHGTSASPATEGHPAGQHPPQLPRLGSVRVARAHRETAVQDGDPNGPAGRDSQERPPEGMAVGAARARGLWACQCGAGPASPKPFLTLFALASPSPSLCLAPAARLASSKPLGLHLRCRTSSATPQPQVMAGAPSAESGCSPLPASGLPLPCRQLAGTAA